MRKWLCDVQDDGHVWYVQQFAEVVRWKWTTQSSMATVFVDEAELAAAYLALDGNTSEVIGALLIVDAQEPDRDLDAFLERIP